MLVPPLYTELSTQLLRSGITQGPVTVMPCAGTSMPMQRRTEASQRISLEPPIDTTRGPHGLWRPHARARRSHQTEATMDGLERSTAKTEGGAEVRERTEPL